MPAQVGQRNDGQRFLVGRLEHDGGCYASVESLAPAPCAYAPAVAVREARKLRGGHRCPEVVAPLAFEFEKFAGHPRADHVNAYVVRAGVATAVTKEPGAGRRRADRKRPS